MRQKRLISSLIIKRSYYCIRFLISIISDCLFVQLFKDRLDSCNFDKICENFKENPADAATDDRY